MPQGDKSSYTAKQKRKAAHIEEGYRKRGTGTKAAAARAWATVNKQDGGAKKKRATATGRTRATGSTRKRTGAAPARTRAGTRSRAGSAAPAKR